MKDYKSLFVLAVVFVIVGVGVVWAIDNAKCVSVLQPQYCSSVGSTGCQIGGADYANATCYSCAVDTTLPQKICVTLENLDSTCNPEGYVYNCGGVPRKAGTCGLDGGIYTCKDQQIVGNCADPTYYHTCL